MILTATTAAFFRLFSPEFRGVFFKSIGLTLLALLATWFGLRELFEWAALPWVDALWEGETQWEGWLQVTTSILFAIVFAIVLGLLIAPASAIIASLFLDDAAEVIEREDYPAVRRGKPVPMIAGFWLSVKFLGVVILGNLLALLLLFVPFVNLFAFFAVNAYLLSREFFEFAALRYRSEAEAKVFRKRHGMTVFLAGLPIAAMLSVPLLNLLTPLFAAALMVHLHLKLSRRDAEYALPPAVQSEALPA
ncbi:cysteine biosynthesis protein CysZ [Notoacmeibacter marinus]|uniref:Cysteine biosynthesis protein CysZ n=1 Tax=Notoacmeibacter marinus TaxID=1876515 RepID=A0A231V1A3_9HYPH|nr:sulfate transporter family protein [Notoacmeibacter marinus]OXT01920.1 cysteine biosynthesis protein CysZ [Notoacmeibacter marinus]